MHKEIGVAGRKTHYAKHTLFMIFIISKTLLHNHAHQQTPCNHGKQYYYTEIENKKCSSVICQQIVITSQVNYLIKTKIIGGEKIEEKLLLERRGT